MTATSIKSDTPDITRERHVAPSVRTTTPNDIPALMRMKRQLAIEEHTEEVLCATREDWQRDAFGPQKRFSALIAEYAGTALGMVTFNERYFTGWVGPTLVVQDLYVDPPFRNHGVGHALLARVAAHARTLNASIIELTVRDDNPARRLYDRSGFRQVRECLTYVLAGSALSELAGTLGDLPPLFFG